MLQIKNTLGGSKPEGLFAWKKNEIGSELKVFNKSVSTLPFNFASGSAVVLNGEIHILGSGYSGNFVKHYKWNGTSWVSVSTLPYNFYYGAAVIFEDEIHILGSDSTSNTRKYHYRFNGSSWVSVSTLPYSFYEGSAVVFNNEIHLLGGNNDKTAHYKWDGSSWTSVSTLPYTFYDSAAVIFDNGVYILGSSTSGYSTAHYLIIGYAPVYTFLDYIVSDKETAYPDGGEQGGYWYERVGGGLTPEMFGLTKMEVIEYIPASDEGLSTRGLSFTHSLGETPKLEILTSDINKSPSYNHLAEYIKFAIGNVTMFTFYSTNFNSNKDLYKISVTKDANTVTIAPYSSSYIPWFISGNTYKFIFIV